MYLKVILYGVKIRVCEIKILILDETFFSFFVTRYNGKTTTMPNAVVDNLRGELPQTPGQPPQPPVGTLPITGEQLLGYTALGGGLLLFIILLICKRKQHLETNPKEIGGDTR